MIELVAFLSVTPVHTTGVNVDGVLANVASITIIMGAFGAVLSRSIKRSLKDTIQEIVKVEIAEQVAPKFSVIQADMGELKGQVSTHATKIARLEGIQEGKRQSLAEATSRERGLDLPHG